MEVESREERALIDQQGFLNIKLNEKFGLQKVSWLHFHSFGFYVV